MKKSKLIYGIILTISILLLISVAIFSRQLTNLDEIWNYNFAKNIADGRLPYKDFNIVQMPGLFIIVAIFLKISNEIIVTRILGALLCTAIIFVTYKIFTKLKINKSISGVISIGITWIFLDYFILDYNFFNLFIILILILEEIKNIDNNSKKFNILLGILAGCSILIKQTTGAFTIIACILFKFIEMPKNNIKEVLKIIAYRCLGILIPIFIFILYLTFNNIWTDFINYTILGLSSFTNKIEYKELLSSDKIYVQILSIIIPIYFIALFIKSIIKKDKKDYIFLFYSLASFIVVYPISDNIHFLIGALPALIGLIYMICDTINLFVIKKIKEGLIFLLSEILKIFSYGLMIFVILVESRNLIKVLKNNLEYNEINHFKYVAMSDSQIDMIKQMDDYILKEESNGKKVYILEADASLFMIPIDKYNKNYDMLLKGNLGSTGEENQIVNIQNMKNVDLLLFSNSKNRNWQTPTSIIEYVENNLEKIGKVEIFDIYGE